MKIPKKYKIVLESIGEYAQKNKIKVWVVGGAVRDWYLKIDTQDIDITVQGDALKLAKFCQTKFGATITKFDKFGTFRADFKNGMKLDFVRARKETYKEPAVLPKVSASNITDDLFRRDFSCNTWALSILPASFGGKTASFGESCDPFFARKSIDKKQIKILHDKSFQDDPTRIFRALRFAGRFNWKLEKSTEKLLISAVKKGYLQYLSKKRVATELLKILQEKEIKRIFKLLEKYKVSKFLHHEFKFSKAIMQVKCEYNKACVIACGFKVGGEEFLRDLQLPREYFNEMFGAYKLHKHKKSSLVELTSCQKEILKAFNPKLSATALKKCLLNGEDAKKLGLKGKQISQAQEKICKLQWRGKIKTKTQAINYLRK
ncbi:MAG: CCA tRNA nucleotidyltransferase [Elusimicrobiaceae bacterium]|nr:CCA tRNA nucleotidyltransferase [Elusimicrobiaceae bacterium]MBT3955491.1 CCA tRNA nucleotidyltransferase [Elusimicrobiaceae bacterium]MBT4008553.1 CCA tRNA nucleotidyltransferase [Elusimicrobiaceae bacterium]MBT4402374.1 CCA tRNA nucleotidyltransferase [Elusimicrobiaceae bacterium]MBT4440056.1 CCA tRNA nucleotidyltransferase [Elusimicrobiaceae bacterium]